MAIIRELLARSLDRKIEEIIKVDQTDERSVHAELDEYIVTSQISDRYRLLLSAIAEAPSEPHEGMAIWVSGFFGSGKSSFAKNLGYALWNPPVLGQPAAELFKTKFVDPRVWALVESINARLPTEVVMFDVQVEQSVKKASERIAEIMYSVLLQKLGYAQDFDLAELEIELEKEEKLETFEALCAERYGDWRLVRKGAQKFSRASALLHAMEPETYSAPDSWARSLAGRSADITVSRFVDRTFELTARRRPGHALVFIMDEVGQYVARSADKIEDLRAVVEQFGKESKNRLRTRQAVAPVWILVTSQEKLDEVVTAIDSKRVELAKLQDRFKYHVDLAPADIREVATRRVLSKKPEAEPLLHKLFVERQGQLNAACHLERTTRRSEVREDEFVQFYPYLPHYIDLSIDIMSGIRLQPGAPRQLGGSNRTIIKQAYEMLVNERTALAEQPVGTLVTLDRVYELVEGNLSSEKQKDIHDIAERFRDDPTDRGWAGRTAKALALLEFVKDLPRTPANVAAMLVDTVGQASPSTEVEAALVRLQEAQFVRETEEGFKLQTAQEKNWETERRGFLEPRPRDRNDIKREILGEMFSDPRLKVYRYQDLRSFRIGITVDGTRVGDEGDVPLHLLVADGDEELPAKLEDAREASRQTEPSPRLYWVLALSPEIHELVANLYASRQMVARYDQLRGQSRITNEEGACLEAERHEVARLQARLRERLGRELQAGTGFFRGVARDGSSLGKTLPEVLRSLLDVAVPDLYPKLAMGARPLKGDEAERVLREANLNGLPLVFYGGEQGLNLVVRDGTKAVPNPSADIARELLDYLQREHSYGNKVTGKTLEEHFSGIPYGWERDVLRLVLAVLLRAGSIEVTHQGRRFRGHQDPQCRVPFTSNAAFRAASFAPRESVGLRTLTTAVEQYEELTGEEVDVEEAAIATAIKKLADEELRALLPLEATARANRLPVTGELEEYKASLITIQNADTDDCVRILAGEGTSLRAARTRVRQIMGALDDAGLRTVERARAALDQMWPALQSRRDGDKLAPAAEALRTALDAETFYARLPEIARLAGEIATAYCQDYTALHDERAERFGAAIEEIKGRVEWTEVPEGMRDIVLASLKDRQCRPPTVETAETPVLAPGMLACHTCQATMGQMESDLLALPGLQSQVLTRIQELIAPQERVVRVRLAEFFSAALDSDAAVDAALERLREHLHKLVAEGTRIVLE